MTKQQKQEYTRRVTAANKTGLITILYDITLDYLQDARDALAREDLQDFDAALVRAQSCIDELVRSLDLGYEIAQTLLALYIFCKRQLIHALATRTLESIGNAEKVFTRLRAVYEELAQMDNDPPIMDNAQTVYAGFTYGRNDLNENVTDPFANRGFRA